MTTPLPTTVWPDTSDVKPPADHLYRSATWLLGRHPQLAALAARVRGVVYVDEYDGELSIDLVELGGVFAAVPVYAAAWEDYESRHRPPDGEDAAFYRWQEAGPKADEFAQGLHDVLVMSSGEVARLRMLATFSTTRVPFKVSDLAPLDDAGRRLLTDWLRAVDAA